MSNPYSTIQITPGGIVTATGSSSSNTMSYPTNPTFPTQQQSSGGSNFQHYWNTAIAAISQYLTAYGRNPTTQISPSGQITGIANPNLIAGYNAQIATTQALAPYQGNQPGGGVGNQAINTASNFLDGIAASFGVSTSTLVIFGSLGIYLLLREPPRRR